MMKYIPSAVTAAGLDESKVEELMGVVSGGAAALKDYSPAVAAAAEAALANAYCKAILYVSQSNALSLYNANICLAWLQWYPWLLVSWAWEPVFAARTSIQR